jgi:hypothetical protein
LIRLARANRDGRIPDDVYRRAAVEFDPETLASLLFASPRSTPGTG